MVHLYHKSEEYVPQSEAIYNMNVPQSVWCKNIFPMFMKAWKILHAINVVSYFQLQMYSALTLKLFMKNRETSNVIDVAKHISEKEISRSTYVNKLSKYYHYTLRSISDYQALNFPPKYWRAGFGGCDSHNFLFISINTIWKFGG